MAGPGRRCNAVIESWHSTIEFELRRVHHFPATAAARAGSRRGSRTTTPPVSTPRCPREIGATGP
jgi:hypothetical protein